MPERYLTRAYTLRLRGPRDGGEEWRDRVWATHEAVNAGAKVFADWLLTLRGGLSPSFPRVPAVPGVVFLMADRSLAWIAPREGVKAVLC